MSQRDQDSHVTWTAHYDGFGKVLSETGSNADRQRANTKEEDPTGLLNEGFRYRDIETGVWLSRDPAGFVDGPNLYAYVRQNPWTAFDPDGLQESKGAKRKPYGSSFEEMNKNRDAAIKARERAKVEDAKARREREAQQQAKYDAENKLPEPQSGEVSILLFSPGNQSIPTPDHNELVATAKANHYQVVENASEAMVRDAWNSRKYKTIIYQCHGQLIVSGDFSGLEDGQTAKLDMYQRPGIKPTLGSSPEWINKTKSVQEVFDLNSGHADKVVLATCYPARVLPPTLVEKYRAAGVEIRQETADPNGGVLDTNRNAAALNAYLKKQR